MFSQRPPRKRGSRNARPSPPRVGSSAGGRGLDGRPERERCGDGAHDEEARANADRVGRSADHRPDDGAEDRDAEDGADHLAPPLPRRAHGRPGERSSPRDGAGEALDEAGDPERLGAPGDGEEDARRREQGEPEHDGALRPEAGGGEPAGDAAEQRARSERPREHACAGLRQVVLLRVARDERRERPEEHRVHEHDRRDQHEEAAHVAEPIGTKKIHRAGCAFVLHPDGPSASAYGPTGEDST